MARNFISIIFITLLLLLAGCAEERQYETDGPFLIVALSPAGPDDFRNLFTRYIAIYDDGKLVMYTESYSGVVVGENAPVYEAELEAAEVEALQQLLEESGFWQMREDVSNMDVMDGISIQVTAYAAEASKTVGGWNPDDPKFMEIANRVYDLAIEAGYHAWEEEMTEYIFEVNPD